MRCVWGEETTGIFEDVSIPVLVGSELLMIFPSN